MRKPFKRGGIRTYLLVIALIGAVFAATPMSILIGSGLLVLGILGHMWSKGCLHQNREVSRTGPYRFVRHPFYTANALLDAGIVVMSGSWILMVLAPIWWLLVYLPVMRQEEGHLTELFGDAYRDYAAGRPRFIPWRKPLPAGPSGFSWANTNIVGHEIGRALRHVTYPFVFLLILRLKQAGWAFFTDPTMVDLLTVTCLLSLWLGSTIWRMHRQQARALLPAFMLSIPVRLGLIGGVLGMGIATQFTKGVDHETWLWFFRLSLLVVVLALMVNPTSMFLLLECVLMVLLTVVFEMIPLAPLVVVLYLALQLDYRLTKPRLAGAMPRFAYACLCLVGVGTAIFCEFADQWHLLAHGIS